MNQPVSSPPGACAGRPLFRRMVGPLLAVAGFGVAACLSAVEPSLPASSTTPIDQFIRVALSERGLEMSPEAAPWALLRRSRLIVTGLPPTPEEASNVDILASRDGWERWVDRLLASPRYGERWAQHWLDAAGYADSNGYFNADTDRPLAYRYRDWVIRSLNQDKPFDQFIREQIAGDELSGWKPGEPVTQETIDLLVATHFLRNGQDGSGESDGNPDEVRTDRYYALESAMQIMGSSLLGLTVQCAKCHDHKFEPFSQQDYYAFQAFLYPAFHIEKWTKPNDRIARAALPGEIESWKQTEAALDAELASARENLHRWASTHRPRGQVLFEDDFALSERLPTRWSASAPGDDAPGGSPPPTLGGTNAPSASVLSGNLRIMEGGGTGDRWICTTSTFEWRPATNGSWIQATFDLIDDRLSPDQSHAERIGYFIAAHDFNDSSSIPGGNILIDGHPTEGSAVNIDYPGKDSSQRGRIGRTGYKPGHNYGVRITCRGTNSFALEHLVDGEPDGPSLTLQAADLPPGAFGFEYCCGRSFIVDNVRIERSDDANPTWAEKSRSFETEFSGRREKLDQIRKDIDARRTPEPGKIAWMTDSGPDAPAVHLLRRGDHKKPGEAVALAFPSFLNASRKLPVPKPTRTTTGRRTAWVNWLLEPDSPQALRLARVTVNRVWQQYFGSGIVATTDNLGSSGARPTHPELLEFLAHEFIRSGWQMKALHRSILLSQVFRQSSAPSAPAISLDPGNHYLWRFAPRRLDAEAIRDSMLVTSGRLTSKSGGPYVPTPRNAIGEVQPAMDHPDAFARTVFLQRRRTQVATFLTTFDAPSIVFNCTRRAETTMPLQSLALLNSDFGVGCGSALAGLILRESADNRTRIEQAFLRTCGRRPTNGESVAASEFLASQAENHRPAQDADRKAWNDLCQSLYALNAFLYLE